MYAGGRVDRLAWLGAVVACLSVLGLAAWLQPSAAGHGTHTQLGLPGCGFLALTGLPCPGCGLTTSFAWLARGALMPALNANPMGVPLFVATLAGVPTGLWGLWRGWSVAGFAQRVPTRAAVWLLGGGLLLAWSSKLLALAIA
jgi:hypothetical protein